MRLLYVCTGNLCRSPVAERLTMSLLGEAVDEDAPDLQVSSAGLSAVPGRPIHPLSAAALIRAGARPDNFRSQSFRPELAEAADLVLTMTRSQRRAVLERTPLGLRRTFTLMEAAALLRHADLSSLVSVPSADRASALAELLDAARRHRDSGSNDDIEDPMGRSAQGHERVARRIAVPVRALASTLTNGLPQLTDRAGTVAAPPLSARRPRWTRRDDVA